MENTLVSRLFSKNPSAIVSPGADFLMVGGLTLVLLPLVMLPVWSDEIAGRAAVIAFYMNFLLNFPHFMHGYQLLYKNYGCKISDPASPPAARARYIIAGIAAPLVLLAFLAFGAMQKTSAVIGFGANLMFFTVGWHYVKQGYGILMTLSARKKVFYDALDKKILLANAYIVWLASWIHFNAVVDPAVLKMIPYKPLPVTAQQDMYVKCAILVWTVFVILFFVRRSGKYAAMSFNGIVGYICSLYPWVLFMLISPVTVMFVPALHSLQYLLFVWKMEYEKTRERLHNAGKAAEITRTKILRRMLPFLGIGFFSGLFFLYFIPAQLDARIAYDTAAFGSQLFMFCFVIFINTHHYFIDFAIWRRDNPEMKYLFR